MIRSTVRIGLSLLAGIFAPAVFGQASDNDGLPADIDTESRSRLPALHRDDLDETGQAAWDLVVGDGARPLTGPVAVSMHSPKIAEAFHLLNQYLRNNGVLEARDFEVAILCAAWEFEQAYEWSGHESAARQLGIPDSVIDAISFNRPVAGLDHRDALIIRFARALLRDHEVSSELYAEVVAEFDRQGIVELATIIGDYVMVGFVLTAADQHLPEGRENTLPQR